MGDHTLEENFVAWALIDNVHQKNPSYSNIVKAETRIKELEQILKFVKMKINKDAINDIIKKWQLRLKEIIMEKSVRSTRELVMVEDDESKAMDLDDNQQENKEYRKEEELINLTGDDDEDIGTDTPKLQNKKQSKTNDNEESDAVMMIQGGDEKQNNTQLTMADRLKNATQKQAELPNYKTLRIRVSVKCKMISTNQEEIEKEIRRIIKRANEISVQFDAGSMMCPWNMHGRSIIKPITGKQIDVMNFDELRNYVHLPNGTSTLVQNQMCHGIGVNIKSEKEINTFIDQWNTVKFKNKKESFTKGWLSIKRAEIQKYHRSFPVGFFQGSSEKGVYESLNYELPKLLGMDIEVSFQNIYQRGITGQFWEKAKNEAKKAGK